MRLIVYKDRRDRVLVQVVVLPEEIKKLEAVFPIATALRDQWVNMAKLEESGAANKDVNDKVVLKALLAGSPHTREVDEHSDLMVDWLHRSKVPLLGKAAIGLGREPAPTQIEHDTADIFSSFNPFMTILCVKASGPVSRESRRRRYILNIKQHVDSVTHALGVIYIGNSDAAYMARAKFQLAVRINKLAKSITKSQLRYTRTRTRT
jgi:hypothetical protein